MAFGSVNVPGGSLSAKQDKIVGVKGQIVGFDANGNAVPQEAPATGVTSFNGRTGAVAPQQGDYTPAMVGSVPTSRKVNGKPLSSDISLSADDVGALPSDGTAAAATKLETGRTIRVNLGSETAVNFNGTANVTPGVAGTLPVTHGGTGLTGLENTSYTTNRLRGITLNSSVPSTVPNGCVALVYV